MARSWSPKADLLCVWLAGAVYQYETEQIQQNPEENNRKIELNSKRYRYKNCDNDAWFFDQDIFGVVASFMNALNEIVSLDYKKTISTSTLRSYLTKPGRGWKAPAAVPRRPKIALPDHILPGEFGQFGLRAVLEATIALVAGTENDTPHWRSSLQRWEDYFQGLEVPAARSTVQEIAPRQNNPSWKPEVTARDHMIDPNSYQGTSHKADLNQSGFEYQGPSSSIPSDPYTRQSEILGQWDPSWDQSALSGPSQYNLLPQNSMESDSFGPYGHSIPQSSSGRGVSLHSSNQYPNPSTYDSNLGEFNSHQFPSQSDSGGGVPFHSSNQYPNPSTYDSNLGGVGSHQFPLQSNSEGGTQFHSSNQYPNPFIYDSNLGEFNSHQFPSQSDSGGGVPLQSSNQYPSASTHTYNFGNSDPPHFPSQSNFGGDGTSHSFHPPPDSWEQHPSQGYQ
ncbi:hypothetical protein EAF04_000529 [Stromatinia cepivora]|nr:hypothetical protein EAF04_000529 [Stromatinia cepivora]